MQKLRKLNLSLQTKSFIIVLVAIAAAVSVYFLINFFGGEFIDLVYLSDSQCDKRLEDYFSSFESYINDNSVNAGDMESVKQWCRQKEYVYVSIYMNGYLLYETDGTFAEIYKQSDSIPASSEYPEIHFSDGTFQVAIIDFSEAKLYDFLSLASVSIAIFLLVATILLFMGSIIYRIKNLSNQIKTVCDRDLEHEITLSGTDEISRLGKNADEMRKSIIHHYENEQTAWKANNELMTSLSHDIRTPLTSLLLYSDALASGKASNAEDIKKYSSVCLDKATQLKELTDTMFRYYFVFGQAQQLGELGEYDAAELLSQLVGEHIFYLTQKGYKITEFAFQGNRSILTDVSMLRRVFDNVFSNLEKYADPEKMITSKAESGDDITVTISNYIAKHPDAAASTKIGLKSCEKMMQLISGKFEYGKKGNIFSVTITIPAKRMV